MNNELDFNSDDILEQIRKQQEAEGLKPKPVKPLRSPVLAKPHTAIYKMHRYYARRPWNVFSHIIKSYTNPGDVILDPFCGGGVTVVEALKLRRRVIGVDVNPLATWITRVEVEPVDLELVEKEFNKWFTWVNKKLRALFRAKCTKCHKNAVAEWVEWSKVIKCDYCGSDVILAKAKKHQNAIYECTNKKCKAKLKAGKSDIIREEIINVMIDCNNCGKRYLRSALPEDMKHAKYYLRNEKTIIKKEKLVIPDDDFPDMNSVRENDLFGKGLYKFSNYFTPRQRIALGLLKKWIIENIEDESVKQCLVHVFSATIRFVNKMVIRCKGWQSGNPIEWAGHIYWPPYTFIEAHPGKPLANRFKALKAGKSEQNKSIGDYCIFPTKKGKFDQLSKDATCMILNQSSHEIAIPDSSVDAIITDPPFGGNVQYGELSDFYLVWIKEFLGLENCSPKDFEAIETRHSGFEGAKDRTFYENMLYSIFKECRRVLKPDSWMVLTFHNRDVGVWMAMNRAAIRAGFRLPGLEECPNRGMIYQPPIENYTQTIHQKRPGSMLGDFILSFAPKDQPLQLDAIKAELSIEEEQMLIGKATEIINYHGGADENTLMTGLLPYLSEQGLLARLARFDLRLLLENGAFTYLKKEKKWYTNDMLENGGALKPVDVIAAEHLTQQLVYSYLKQNKVATIDELLIIIYKTLVNAHRPQMSTIGKVITKYCKRIKTKSSKRELYVWNEKAMPPIEKTEILKSQTLFDFALSPIIDHDEIIKFMANIAIINKFNVHVGKTEQKKSKELSDLSINLSGLELGLSPDLFKHIQEIDLIILKNNTIISCVEVTTTISTFNKAINDRFRNMLSIAPNLKIKLGIVVRDVDYEKALMELNTPANRRDNLPQKVRIWKIKDINSSDFKDWLTSLN
jgi:putative DNA methylase